MKTKIQQKEAPRSARTPARHRSRRRRRSRRRQPWWKAIKLSPDLFRA